MTREDQETGPRLRPRKQEAGRSADKMAALMHPGFVNCLQSFELQRRSYRWGWESVYNYIKCFVLDLQHLCIHRENSHLATGQTLAFDIIFCLFWYLSDNIHDTVLCQDSSWASDKLAWD